MTLKSPLCLSDYLSHAWRVLTTFSVTSAQICAGTLDFRCRNSGLQVWALRRMRSAFPRNTRFPLGPSELAFALSS